jgi:hypothetical protein
VCRALDITQYLKVPEYVPHLDLEISLSNLPDPLSAGSTALGLFAAAITTTWPCPSPASTRHQQQLLQHDSNFEFIGRFFALWRNRINFIGVVYDLSTSSETMVCVFGCPAFDFLLQISIKNC